MPSLKIQGLIPAVVTAFKYDSEDYDRERHRTHMEWLRDVAKVPGFTVCAGGGEFYSLTEDEIKQCQETAVEVGHGKVQVWFNFGAESYRKVSNACKWARDAGVDGLRIENPYFRSYSPNALLDFFKDFAKEFSDMPIMLYPMVHESRLTKEAIVKLAEIDNIVGMKLTGPPWNLHELVYIDAVTKKMEEDTGKQFQIIPGSVQLFYHLARAGITVDASAGPETQVMPEVTQLAWTSYVNEDWDTFRKAAYTLIRCYDDINVPGQGGWKYALKLLGRDNGPPRKPGFMPQGADAEKIKRALITAGALAPDGTPRKATLPTVSH